MLQIGSLTCTNVKVIAYKSHSQKSQTSTTARKQGQATWWETHHQRKTEVSGYVNKPQSSFEFVYKQQGYTSEMFINQTVTINHRRLILTLIPIKHKYIRFCHVMSLQPCTSAYDIMNTEKQILSVSINQGYSFELYDGSHECLCSHWLLSS
jgi:hypothetical protein